jgi:signal transduction histidine kinase
VRLERPAHALEHLKVDVSELLGHILAEVAIEADAQGCIVTLTEHEPLFVSGDPELLRSAFENVIRNAVRYSPVGTVVAVSARRVPGQPGIEVAIRDQGPGVPEKDLGLIFEPFYRVEAAREHRSTGGEGLGLAIAARAVTLHGGSIAARNLEGGGLAVTVLLPAAARSTMHEPAVAAA